jgi:hypothetical protein
VRNDKRDRTLAASDLHEPLGEERDDEPDRLLAQPEGARRVLQRACGVREGFRRRAPGKDWRFPCKLPKNGAENSKRSVPARAQLCRILQPAETNLRGRPAASSWPTKPNHINALIGQLGSRRVPRL